jgi:NAD(P)-dependent dehydrogenase (short-subunit alcohol dehydrogenase family)
LEPLPKPTTFHISYSFTQLYLELQPANLVIMAHPNRLHNARVLIFGGTSGIGFAVASLCLSSGAQVIISGSKQPKVDSKVAALQSFYPSLSPSNLSGYALDLLDSANLEKNMTALFDKVTKGGEQKLNHIVFSAGEIASMPHISKATVDEAMAYGKMRFLGQLMIAKHLINGKYMASSSSSSLTFTGGTNSKKPIEGFAMGAAWGCSTEGLMRGCAVDLKPIRVNMVEPGAINTELLQGFVKKWGDGLLDTWAKATLLNKVGEPSDIAEAYGWFMRDPFVTGTVAASDGGRLLV